MASSTPLGRVVVVPSGLLFPADASTALVLCWVPAGCTAPGGRELHGHPRGFLRAPATGGRSPHDRPFGFVRSFVRASARARRRDLSENLVLLRKRVGEILVFVV
jgi:hypothetical protein